MASVAFDMREAEDVMLTQHERTAKVLGLSECELRRYARLFHVFDRDSDGCIDAEELMLLLKTIGVPATRDTAQSMISAKDVNGSGQVEYQEFIEIMVDQGGDSELWTQLIERLDETKVLAQDFMAKSEEARQHVNAALASNRMKPDGKVRVSLDALVTVGTLYFYIAILLENVDKTDAGFSSVGKGTCEVLFSLLFLLDILVILNTAVQSETGARTVTDRKSILITYLRSHQVLIDVPSVLPLEFILTGWRPRSVFGRVVRHLRLLKVLRLPSMFVIENTGLMSPNLVTFYFRIVPLFLNAVKGMFILHTFSIIWILLKDDSSYIDALYFVLYTITTVGYGDIEVSGTSQKTYACFLLVVGACINGLTVGYLTAFIMRSDIEGDKVDKMRQTLAVLRHFKVPTTLQEEILSYQYHVLQHNLGVAYTDVIAGLPPAMQEQVSLYMRVRLVTQVPMFNVCEIAVQIALAQSLKNVVVPPDEYIIVAGEEGHEMFFLSHGFSDVLSSTGDLLATITKGGFFGEVALLVETQRHTNVKALTFCDLFILQRVEFNLILNRYPSFAAHIHQEILQASTGREDENPTSETEALRGITNEVEDEDKKESNVCVLGVLSKLKMKASSVRKRNALDKPSDDDKASRASKHSEPDEDNTGSIFSQAPKSFLRRHQTEHTFTAVQDVSRSSLPGEDNSPRSPLQKLKDVWNQPRVGQGRRSGRGSTFGSIKDVQELKSAVVQQNTVQKQILVLLRELKVEVDAQAVLNEERFLTLNNAVASVSQPSAPQAPALNTLDHYIMKNAR